MKMQSAPPAFHSRVNPAHIAHSSSCGFYSRLSAKHFPLATDTRSIGAATWLRGIWADSHWIYHSPVVFWAATQTNCLKVRLIRPVFIFGSFGISCSIVSGSGDGRWKVLAYLPVFLCTAWSERQPAHTATDHTYLAWLPDFHFPTSHQLTFRSTWKKTHFHLIFARSPFGSSGFTSPDVRPLPLCGCRGESMKVRSAPSDILAITRLLRLSECLLSVS